MNMHEVIQQRLALLEPQQIEITDLSDKHAKHVSAPPGSGHYKLLVVSAQFEGKPLLVRHRMIYDALSDLMPHKIHALTIKAITPDLAGQAES